MRVLLLSTFGTYGGAAVCSKRLYQALHKSGVYVKLGVVHAWDGHTSISLLKDSWWNKLKIWFLFSLERVWVLLSIRKKSDLYAFSSGNVGLSLHSHPLVQEADVIHLHWIHFGFISIQEIRSLSLIKPVIWTLHDMWSFTGGCHYALSCNRYESECNDCPYLRRKGLARCIQKRKMIEWNTCNFLILGTSRWITECARRSSVFKDHQVACLPTPIDTNLFAPISKNASRSALGLKEGRFYVLFGAVSVSDSRKGFSLLVQAIARVSQQIPNLHLLVFGQMNTTWDFSCEVTSFGSIKDPKLLVSLYNASDVFVLPSIQDNLPNTVMEAMACGVPVVAFNSGGVSDMVDHKENGYLAKNLDSNDLVEGILFTYQHLNGDMGIKARKKVEAHFSEEVISREHIEVYQKTMNTWPSKS